MKNSKEIILVVDDNKDLADALAEILRMEDFHVLTAYGYKQGQTLIEENRHITCLVTDTDLGDGLGTDLVRFYKIRYPDNAAFRTSGSGDLSECHSGETEFLSKPFQTTELLEKIRKHCKK